jgi:nucleotide-binding universal stress UspA family protein
MSGSERASFVDAAERPTRVRPPHGPRLPVCTAGRYKRMVGICDRMVVAVDFSEASKVAVRAAFELARRCGTKRLTMIHAVRPVVFPAESQLVVREHLANLRQRIHDAAESQLDAMCDELAAPAELSIDHRIVEGHPAEVIPESAEEMQATLLAIGSHSRKGVRRWLSGSVAETMLLRVRCPTLVMLTGEDGVPPEAELSRLACILVAIDEDPAAEEVARTGFLLARSLTPAPRVVLYHSVEPTGFEVLSADDPDLSAYFALLEERARKTAEAIVAMHGAGLQVEVVIDQGKADDAIVEAADRLPAQLIVMGNRRSGLAAMLHLGSTAAHVVRHSDVSVLVVPERAE